MHRSARGRLATAFALVAALAAPAATVGSASAAPPRPVALLDQLRESTGGGARVDQEPGSGRVTFFGTAPGRAARRPSGVSSTTAPEAAAREFVKGYGRLFGVRDAAAELHVAKAAKAGPKGIRTVRFEQRHGGVPVMGGDLVVQLEADNDVVAAYGETAEAPATTTPRVTAAQAGGTARSVIARDRQVAAGDLRVAAPALTVYDSQLLGVPGVARSALVWRTEVTSAAGEDMKETVLVDAATGSVALHFDSLAHAKVIRVCDNKNVRTSTDACPSTRLVGSPTTSSVADVRNAHRFSSQTYDFFASLGRDSLDNRGMALTSVVRYCRALPSGVDATGHYACPLRNAYWNGTHMVYGSGYASADDVVGHELTHGVTDHESGLYYLYESGAINESLSDVMGELIDQRNDAAGDTGRWLLGEDSPDGPLRSMWNPPAVKHPDTITSGYWSDYPIYSRYWDNGGVHTNSGVGNKAAYLIHDGAAFGTKPATTGLGNVKTARLFYNASLALTSGANYRDLYNVLQQTCANLVGTNGFTATDCTAVKQSLDAVKMSAAVPGRGRTGTFAPSCAAGKTLRRTFSDNLENPASGNWSSYSRQDSNRDGVYYAHNDRTDVGRWFYPQNSHSYGSRVDLTYATSGDTNMWGENAHYKVDSTISSTRAVAVTGVTYLQFNHSYEFDYYYSGGTRYTDGGRVEYTTDGGKTWFGVPSSWMTANKYNGTVFKASSTSQYDSLLAGYQAFVGSSKGYTTTRINLSSLASKSIRFRFRTSSDAEIGTYGWFIDDVVVYNCEPYTTALSIGRNAAEIVSGGSAGIRGRLTYAGTTAGIAGKTVDVYGRPVQSPAAAWVKLGSRTTTASGTYSLVHKPTVNYEYTARFWGPAPYNASPSAALVIKVAPAISGTLHQATISRTATTSLYGVVSPAHVGATVRLQKLISGVWKDTSSTRVLNNSSAYSFKLGPGVAGKHTYRVVLPAHADHAMGRTGARTLTVT